MGFIEKHFGGHISIGRLTVYGCNAMHWGVTFWTKRWGYICFRLPFRCYRRWWPLYLYCSPNATPWASTFMLGRKHNRDNWALARVRRRALRHNFKYESEPEDYNYKRLREINNILYPLQLLRNVNRERREEEVPK